MQFQMPRGTDPTECRSGSERLPRVLAMALFGALAPQTHRPHMPGAHVTIVEKPGHFPTSENPEQFRDYIAPVLQQIP
jgi:pimeloyl-ACP methyl ester carboxylesterase